MRRLWTLVATVLLCVAGVGRISAVAPIVHPPLTAVTTPAPCPADQAAAAAKVNQAMQAILPNVQVGFEIFDRVSGTVLTSHDADRPVASMSVVKLLIALDALARENGNTPGGTLPQDLHQMLANSDDQIASELWTAGGGPALVIRMVRLLDLTGTRPPDDPGAWGDTRTTPQDMVRVYRYITDHLPSADQDLVLGALADTSKIAADGFDQHFGIPDGMPQLRWAVKQGWGTSGSQAVMNSTGLVGTQWRYIVVMLASAPVRSYVTLPTVVTAGAEALASVACATAL